MYNLIKFFLFKLNPEKAHSVALSLIETTLRLPVIGKILKYSFKPSENSNRPVEFGGITFPNHLGLAAGFDKDAKHLKLWKDIGFGHVEVGTVTPKPQSGNPKPRLFRLVSDEALINRMGFNNDGVSSMVERLKKRPEGLIVGGNIGKNKVTPNEEAENDYIHCFNELYDHVDYITVNVSSPNTPGLRDLQSESFLVPLFEKLNKIREEKGIFKPLFLKIAPDFHMSGLKRWVIKKLPIQGIIATNTTISRDDLETSEKKIKKIGAGGLSGRPLFEASTAIQSTLSIELGIDIPIIGVGGIFNADDANEKISRGAGLIQIYTGFVYQGPWIVKSILNGIKYED
jgi:dihydroorotate dehydrogenase